MNLIDRYIHEVGRHLPRKNKKDIQIELRSSICDAMEDQIEGEPSEASVAEFLRAFGAPKRVAASYHPEGQYLIGPELFPLFRMVAGITLAAVAGAQLLAWSVALLLAQSPFSPLEALGSLVNSIPTALGMVVIVFAVLQWFEVRPEIDEGSWDPKMLPQIDETQPVKRGERIFGIVAGIIILVVLVFFPEYIGFVTAPGGQFYPNPVIPQYLVWISLSLLINVALDIYLLWQGRWTGVTRILKLGANLASITVLAFLVQGHSVWLFKQRAGGFISSLESLATDPQGSWQLIGMQAYRLAFAVALIVTVFDTLAMVVRRVLANIRSRQYPEGLPSREV